LARRVRTRIPGVMYHGCCGRRRVVMWERIRTSPERRDGFAVAPVSGELDILTSRRFDECLAEARRDDDHIIIDLSAVDFMDTGSLAVIVGHWKQVTAPGGTLALAGARDR